MPGFSQTEEQRHIGKCVNKMTVLTLLPFLEYANAYTAYIYLCTLLHIGMWVEMSVEGVWGRGWAMGMLGGQHIT